MTGQENLVPLGLENDRQEVPGLRLRAILSTGLEQVCMVIGECRRRPVSVSKVPSGGRVGAHTLVEHSLALPGKCDRIDRLDHPQVPQATHDHVARGRTVSMPKF